MKKCRRAKTLLSILLLSTFFILTGCGDNKDTTTTANIAPIINTPGKHNFGVVAFANGGIAILDGRTQTTSAPLLVNELGSEGGGRFDVAITPDGMTTLVSNFGDSKVFFIDTSDPSKPGLLGSLDIKFFAEDIDITPNGRYALVTDGGFSPSIAVVDIKNRTLVETFGETDEERTLNVSDSRQVSGIRSAAVKPERSIYHCAVAIAKDGKTVLTVDYFTGKVHTLVISDSGHLTYVCSTDVSNGGTLLPVNLSISPDGITVIVASVYNNSNNKSVQPSSDGMAFPVLAILAPGVVKLVNYVKPCISQATKPCMEQLIAAQSVVFNRTGTKAYLNCVQAWPETPPNPDYKDVEPEIEPKNVIVTLNIFEPGIVMDAGTPKEVDFIGRSQLFGVDTLALDYDKNYLWISNMTLSQARNHLQVMNLNTGAIVKTISFDPIILGTPPEEELTLPVGLCFWNP